MRDLNYEEYFADLLPPANEVWGKVIFLPLSVNLFTGGSAWPLGGLVPGCAWPWGVPGPKGCLVWGDLVLGVPGGDLPWTAIAAGTTHPTGMHSCFEDIFAVCNSKPVLHVVFSKSKVKT